MKRTSVIAALILLAGLASAQTADDIQREIARLKTQVAEERRQMGADSLRQAQWRTQSRQRLEAMREESRLLARQRDSLERIVNADLRRPTKTTVADPNTANKRRFALSLASAIEEGIPLARTELDSAETARQWSELVTRLRKDALDPVDGLGQYLDLLAEGIDHGSRIQLRSGTYLTASGRALRGQFLRLGRNTEFFVDRNGEQAFLSTPGLPAKELPESQIRPLAAAVSVVSGSASPQWLFLPAPRGNK